MDYKSILVHVGPDAAAEDRIRLAARIARTTGAHLIGSAFTGISRYAPSDAIAADGSVMAVQCASLRRHAELSLQAFDRIVREEEVASTERRLIDDAATDAMAIQARYCDLVVVSQVDRSNVTPTLPDDLPEYLILESSRPVLVTPFTGCVPTLDGGILVAWDGSVEATRAISGALPLLQVSCATTVLGFGEDDAGFGLDEAPLNRLAAYLGRHGVHARIAPRTSSDDVGEALLSAASDAGVDLLVMGGYGHSRYRELVLGGVTATILRSMTLPVLFSH
jgi:nucleotide-binding universal stress UspA family protein